MQTREYVQIVLVPLFGLIATLAIGFTALLWQGGGLEDRLQNVENRVYDQGEHLQALDRRVHAVEQGMQTLDRRMQTMEQGMQAMEQRMQTMEQGMQAMEQRMHTIEADVSVIKAQIIDMNAVLAQLLALNDRQAEREPAAEPDQESAP